MRRDALRAVEMMMEEIGPEAQPIDENVVEAADNILADDDLVGFAVVGVRHTDDDGFQMATSRGPTRSGLRMQMRTTSGS